jgi:hypothetical protein
MLTCDCIRLVWIRNTFSNFTKLRIKNQYFIIKNLRRFFLGLGPPIYYGTLLAFFTDRFFFEGRRQHRFGYLGKCDRYKTKIRRMPVIVSASAGSGLRAGIKRVESSFSNRDQQHTSQRNMFASFTDKQQVVANMWKRMSFVFDSSTLQQAGELAPAEPLVGSNGLLTLSALEQAKKLNSDHKPHTCHLRYKCLCVRAHAHTHRARVRMPVVNNG